MSTHLLPRRAPTTASTRCSRSLSISLTATTSLRYGYTGFYIDHVIDMADMLSTGTIEQFPSRFSPTDLTNVTQLSRP